MASVGVGVDQFDVVVAVLTTDILHPSRDDETGLVDEGDVVAKRYKAPKELLYGRKVKTKGKELTDEQKEALAMRFKR